MRRPNPRPTVFSRSAQQDGPETAQNGPTTKPQVKPHKKPAQQDGPYSAQKPVETAQTGAVEYGPVGQTTHLGAS